MLLLLYPVALPPLYPDSLLHPVYLVYGWRHHLLLVWSVGIIFPIGLAFCCMLCIFLTCTSIVLKQWQGWSFVDWWSLRHHHSVVHQWMGPMLQSCYGCIWLVLLCLVKSLVECLWKFECECITNIVGNANPSCSFLFCEWKFLPCIKVVYTFQELESKGKQICWVF